MSSAISAASAAGKSLLPTSVERAMFPFKATRGLTMARKAAATVSGVPVDANLKVALFSDVGRLWATGASNFYLSTSQQITNSQAMRASIGTALIWNSPLGSPQVNYAYPVAKQPYDVTQRLNSTAAGF